MGKQNPNVTYCWCFLEKDVESSICQWFKFFLQLTFNLLSIKSYVSRLFSALSSLNIFGKFLFL